ncbi:MAG: ABC-2 transporter permease [Anaerolineales bacterium]|jgi:ABC-type transport system involved in multi-copper enzyme maturation permease subunit
MTVLRNLYHLTRADFLERVRRASFLIVLVSTLIAGYLFVPPVGAGYRVLEVGSHRGIYNSEWIGLMFGLIAALHLSLIGFFLVKNAVQRDHQTGVGQIIATTPISKLTYVFGKWLSNLAVLIVILSVMTIIAMTMQLVRAEEHAIHFWALATPIWLMGLPVLGIAAALAVLFECTSFLKGGLGNVVFLFLWLLVLGLVMTSAINQETEKARQISDPYGYTRQLVDIQDQVLAVDPNADLSSGLLIITEDEDTFVWEGIQWTMRILLERLMWVGLALVLVVGASIPFDRFDPAQRRAKSERTDLRSRLKDQFDGGHRMPKLSTDAPAASIAKLTPLDIPTGGGRFLGVFFAELKLMFKGPKLIWYIVLLGINIACLLNPSDPVQPFILMVVWIWPIAVWSQMGAREHRHNTWQIIFCAPRPALRQLPAMWLAGVVVAVIAGSGAWLYIALSGEMAMLFAWFGGALFVPALALALGVWAGSSRVFEAIYLFIWYLGLVEGVPVLDFAGTTSTSLAMGIPYVYLLISACLVGLALFGRIIQSRRS